MSRKSARTRVRQLACLGLPSGLFVASMLPVLTASTRSHGAAFFWVDDRGGIVNAYADRLPLTEVESVVEFAKGAGGSSRLPDVDSPAKTFTLDEEHEAEGLYAEILRRNAAHHILHGLPVHNGTSVGRVALFRRTGSRGYGPREIGEVASVVRYVGHGLMNDPMASGDGGTWSADDALAQEMLVAHSSGRLVYATEDARRLLLLSTGCRLAPDTLSRATATCEILVRALCEAASTGKSQMVRDTIWGRFVLRAYSLMDQAKGPEAPFGIHIKHVRPRCLRLLSALSDLPLSPQQREIALMIANGRSNRDIAERLAVTVNTVAYHVKQLFLKVNVHDRAALLAKISSEDAEVCVEASRESMASVVL